jgi:hypothetical protein
LNDEEYPIVHRIVVNVQVASDRLAASDDPIFLGLRGPNGREFRLVHAKGKSWRRGAKETYILAAQGDSDANVDHPELNDPAVPSVDLDRVVWVYLRKGLEPIPNVRGHGEMDDRLGLDWIEVELHASDGRVRRFERRGELWLGLVCGMFLELAPADSGG